jgi:hypothetical protein
MTASDGAPGWSKPQASGNSGNCVEVLITADRVRVRDTKEGGLGSELRFTHSEWAAFVDGVRKGEFDLPG